MLRKLVYCLICLLTLCTAQTALAHDESGSKLDVTLEGTAAGSATANFTAIVDPLVSGSRLQLEWTLPPGVELLGGPALMEWADPQAGVPYREARTIRANAPGVYRIFVGAGLHARDGMRYVQGALLFMTVGEDGSVTLSHDDPTRADLSGSIMPTSVEQDLSAAAMRAPNDDPCFTVTGRVMREEHTPTQSGYTQEAPKPVRAARIEMREEDIAFDDSYGETFTGSDGSYSFHFCDDDGVFDDDLEIYVRLYAEIESGGHAIVEVQEDGLIPPESVYEFDSNVIESDGGTYTINFNLNRDQSAVFNIADTIYDTWLIWNANGGAVGDDAIFDYQAEVNWEKGDGDDKTFYNGYVWDEITIADSNSNPDEWDDSVIIHEWTHQADDNYGCDDNPGGEHSSRDSNQDPELAFAEGFANYYQSAVRKALSRTDNNWYLDNLGPGSTMVGGYDLETWDTTNPTLVTWRNEAAVAALLWDLEDAAVDNGDRVGFGLRANQETFTDPVFSENGDIFDDSCTTWVYLKSWRDTGKQANTDVASIIQQNVGLVDFFNNLRMTAAQDSVAAAEVAIPAGFPGTPDELRPLTAAAATAQAGQSTFKWWKNLTWVVDTSASMGAAGKLESVKTVMKEQVNDLAADPKGVEFNLYTFNNNTLALQQPMERKFYPDLANPAIDALTAAGTPDGDCSVNALNAIAQAAQRQNGGHIWLYTDRATGLGPGIDSVRRLLNERQARGSFAMLGGCAAVLPAKMSDVTGGELNYLGTAANGSQDTGIVPYLLTALGTGGQFIYVREDQLGSAADILRAQVANSAGAGKWSDYVSDDFTYRWDRLEAGEYQWFPAESLGEGVAQIPESGYVRYDLPTPFPLYGSPRTRVGVSQDGVIEFNPCASPCPIIPFFRSFLNVLSTDMQWGYRDPGPRLTTQAEGTGAESGADPAATDPTATDPAATDPAATDPAATDPTAIDPTAIDPTAIDPTAIDPTATDPAATDPAATDPTATDPAATDPAATDPAATDPAATDPAATDPAATDPAAAGIDVALTPGVYNPACLDLINGGSWPNYEWVCVYQANFNFEWHIISVQGYRQDGSYRAYQAWLNTNTGEIRLLYGNLGNEAATAHIGLRTFSLLTDPPSDFRFTVSNNDSAGASSGMGYKLAPAPPQPTRVYTVNVDALMTGVGFLQTGYSGRFEPMIVRDPAGQPVNCADTANVLCITMDNVAGDRMVQYVQVNVNGNVGDWTATIDAQEGAEGTFTFSGLAASSIAASTTGERSLRSTGAVRLAVQLGQAVDGNILNAWLQRPNGDRFGNPFQLFDDGAHGDGLAGDGLFALADLTAPGEGVGYLWVQGSIGGQGFVRSDPVPYNFQPLEVKVLLKNQVYTGGAVRVWLEIVNHDSVAQCFYYGNRVTVPDGWSYYWEPFPGADINEQFIGVCIPAGGTIYRVVLIVPSGEFDGGPSGTSGEVAVSFVELQRGAISDSDTATITRYREAVDVRILNPLGENTLRPTGVDTATLTVGVYDSTGFPVMDGTQVEISTDLGTVEPAPLGVMSAAGAEGVAANSYTAETRNGRAVVVFTAPAQVGDAKVSATVNGKTATATVYIRAATAESIVLSAAPADLSKGDVVSSTLTAIVRDTWGDPLPGATVRIGIADDSGTQGTIRGSDVFTATTNTNGRVRVVFTRAPDSVGQVRVRAEYVILAGGQEYVPTEDSVVLYLTAPEWRLYLPNVQK